MNGPALVALTPVGLALAVRLKAALPRASVHMKGEGGDESFDDAVHHLRRLFVAGSPIVGLCAAGILVRALSPLVADKRTEPPVVALAEDGSVAVPLLGGHRGANRLARDVAEALGGTAAITTAGDVRFGVALDDPPPGWQVANPAAAKAVAAALLAAEPVALSLEVGDAGWLTGSRAPFVGGGDAAARRVRVTDRAVAADGAELVLHPPVLVVGVGCERGAAAEELLGLVGDTLAGAGLSRRAVACLATLDVKMDEAAVHTAAQALGVPVRFFSASELETQTPRLANPSETVFKAVGCHGVAEAAALAVAGPNGKLVVEKAGSKRATCAVARSPADIIPATVGRPRGRLAVVGLGPGTPDWRTPEATRALRSATDVVGYRLYLDLVAGELVGKRRHESPMTHEEDRCRIALDLAAEGRTVALVGSGDPGIYALASLVFELLDREDRADWNRIAVSVTPGVSAMQAAAARLGAPLGHDFCAVSLSDLLTPWSDIERRLRAVAEGDFVVALYNPVSKRRQRQLALARDILLGARPPETPVVLARNVGRPGETSAVVRLADLEPAMADMLTIVLVGSSNTRMTARGGRTWVYTPRGYEKKMDSR